MPHEDQIRELAQRREQALAMGGAARLEARRSAGVLNARERLAALLDPDSFVESGLLAKGWRTEVRDRSAADGKVAGFGRIDGRDVAVVANDFTVLGSSSSVVNGKKIRHMKEVASSRGMPLIFLAESSGARIPDRMGATGRSILGQDPTEYRRLRETPWVSALLGDCYGSSTWYAAMSDFVVMRKGATMAVASPRVTSLAIGEEIDASELGGWRLHSERSGLVDSVAETDEEALECVKRFLGYLPSHREQSPPRVEVDPRSENREEEVLAALPEARTRGYDMRKLVDAVFDFGSRIELKARFGRSLVTALVRLDGRTVGVLANNPMFKGGALDVDACKKATSFLVLCDSFNVPVVTFVDVPGFLVGIEGEQRGAPGRIINWMNALQLMTVPKLSVIVRKSYGQAYLNMGGGRNSDEVVCWPTADLGFMDPSIGVNVVYGVTREQDEERFEELRKEISRDSTAWDLAALYEAQDVIDPRETRQYLKDTLRVHWQRMTNGVGQHLLSNWPTSY